MIFVSERIELTKLSLQEYAKILIVTCALSLSMSVFSLSFHSTQQYLYSSYMHVHLPVSSLRNPY
jgi:hypothetical protein